MSIRNEREARKLSLLTKLNEVLDEGTIEFNDPTLIPSIMGMLMAKRKSYDHFTTKDNGIDWMMDAYTAQIVGPLANDLLRLHQFLVSVGATPETPHDFEHCDRYGAVFSDGDWKSMALMTQNYTYMAVLQPAVSFDEDADGQLQKHDKWAIHIRICTKDKYSHDYARPNFSSLAFLGDYDKVHPEIGYGDKANEYFRYKDGRDQGYLCSVQPNMVGDGFRTENSLWGSAFSYLGSVLYDLGCHCSCLPKE